MTFFQPLVYVYPVINNFTPYTHQLHANVHLLDLWVNHQAAQTAAAAAAQDLVLLLLLHLQLLLELPVVLPVVLLCAVLLLQLIPFPALHHTAAASPQHLGSLHV